MINNLEDYLLTKNGNITFGQIPDEPDSITHVNIYLDSNNLFFNNDGVFRVILVSFVRDKSYSGMQSSEESFTNIVNALYDIDYEDIRIVNAKKTLTQEPLRDNKNRYCIFSEYEIIIERKV